MTEHVTAKPTDNIETGDRVIATEVRYVGKDWTRVERTHVGTVTWVGEKGLCLMVHISAGRGTYEVVVHRSAASLLSKANPCLCDHADHFRTAKHTYGHATAGEQSAVWVGKVCDDCAATCMAGHLV